MRKIILILALFIIWGCKKDSVKIGFVAGLSGSHSTMGIEERNGVALAVNEINKTGGIKGREIEVIYKDDQNNPNAARFVVSELIDEGVEAIIGHMTSTMTLSTIELVREADVVMISPSTSTGLLSGYDDIFYRMVETSVVEARDISIFARKTLNIENVVVIYDSGNMAYTKGWAETFASNFPDAILIEFDKDNNDSFNNIAVDIKEISPQGIAIAMGAYDSALLSQQLWKREVKGTKFFCGWAKTVDLLSMGGKAVEGGYFSEMFSINSKDKDYIKFRDKFERQYSYKPSFAGVHSYEAVMLFKKAFETKQFNETLKESLDRIDKMKGLQGTIYFDKYGDVIRDHHIIIIKDGKYTDY